MSDEEQEFFLSVNVSTSKWSKVDQMSKWKADNTDVEVNADAHAALMEYLTSFHPWDGADHKAEASYDRHAGILLIRDVDPLERLATERDKIVDTPPPVATQGF